MTRLKQWESRRGCSIECVDPSELYSDLDGASRAQCFEALYLMGKFRAQPAVYAALRKCLEHAKRHDAVKLP